MESSNVCSTMSICIIKPSVSDSVVIFLYCEWRTSGWEATAIWDWPIVSTSAPSGGYTTHYLYFKSESINMTKNNNSILVFLKFTFVDISKSLSDIYKLKVSRKMSSTDILCIYYSKRITIAKFSVLNVTCMIGWYVSGTKYKSTFLRVVPPVGNTKTGIHGLCM